MIVAKFFLVVGARGVLFLSMCLESGDPALVSQNKGKTYEARNFKSWYYKFLDHPNILEFFKTILYIYF